MKIFNGTKNSCIASQVAFADDFIARLKGLLGRDGLPDGQALVISPCISIHTIGMKFPIDAVFFDSGKRAVGVIRGIRPGRLSRIYPKAKGVIEMAGGTLSKQDVEPGDELVFAELPPWPKNKKGQ
jgi:uncharacterized membrane protein (UPF0127 family)